MAPSGLDQSWGVADPVAAARAGVQAISMYLSWDTSKNITASKVKRYHAVGIGSGINWESQAGAPLKGAAQGRADATEAVRQLRVLIKAVGYAPKNRLVIYFSCDRDVTGTQIAGPVADYYRAARDVCHAAGFGVGAYGEAALIHYLAAHGITDAEWQTYAWSGGVLDPATDFYQYNNGQTLGGASVDFDRVIHPYQMGFWWPPTSPYNTAGSGEFTMDAEAKAAFAALNAKVDAIPAKTWSVKLKNLENGKLYSAGTYLVNINKTASVMARKVGPLAVDAAAVAVDIKNRIISLLGGSA